MLFHKLESEINKNKRPLINKVQYTTDARDKLHKQATKKYKLSKRLIEMKANNYIGKPRHFSPLSNEWYNSIYTFNMNLLKILPTLNKILLRIVKSYFNFYSRKLEKNIKSRRLRIKARRLSINKILTSKPQLRHTNDQIIITLYTYNRQKIYYLNKLKKIASLLFTVPDMDKLAVYNDIYTREKRLQNLKADSFTKVEDLNPKISNNNKILQLPFSDNSQTSRVNTINNKQSLKINSYNDLLHVQPMLKDNDGIDSLLSAVYTSRSLDIFKNYKTYKHVDNIRKTCNGVFIENQKQAICAPTPLNLISSDYTHDRQKKVFKNIKNVDVSGIRIEAAGRLTKRNTAAKSVFKLRYIGNIKDMDSSYKGLSSVILRGFAKSNLQHTKSASYIRIGSYGMKVWISSFLSRRLYLYLISTYLFYIYFIYNQMFILFICTYLYT
uniref:Ribosomal subunit protein subunit S3 n=1 Tax=Cladonia macilenta TaxID=196765 RepID=A0A4V1DXN6_9LECA|nr:ribosomal subunit protein subunit S3 [Cladonia macilenta]QCL16951.1 ribosomal subunit protein subunit S3 [Cladonia macilenta]